MDQPVWWDWELAFTDHVAERMAERNFSETDIRLMLSTAADWRPSHVYGRFILEMTWVGESWEVVVEPDELTGLLYVITAFRVG